MILLKFVILCVGLDANLEGEEGDAGNQFNAGDKYDLYLPQSQRTLIEKVLAVGKPTVVVVAAGSSLNVKAEQANAIVQAWYPGALGGIALADILFGKVSPSGKLPLTFYENSDLLPDFEDYSMKGRTYRYLDGNVQYPFGFGLTYSKVECTKLEYANGVAKVDVANVGKVDTEEVVQLYIKDNKSKHAAKNHKLCGFQRISLKAGEKLTVEIALDKAAFDVVDDSGKRFVDSDSFTLFAGVNQPDALSEKLSGVKCVKVEITK